MAPLVSVVVRTWNRAHLVGESLSSIQAQTVPSLDIVVVDDGSTDGTQTVVRGTSRTDSRIHLVEQSHRGPAAALNAGVRAARGEYLSFLDSDDLWEPQCVERRLAAFRADPTLGAVLVDWTAFGDGPPRPSPRGRLARTSGDLLEVLFATNFFSLCAAMVPTRVFHDIGEFDETLGAAEDYDWGLRLATCRPIEFLPDLLMRCRTHANHVTADPRVYRFRCDVLERFAAMHADRIPPGLVRQRLAETNAMVGGDSLAMGDFTLARRHLWRAIGYAPFRRDLWKAWIRACFALTPRGT